MKTILETKRLVLKEICLDYKEDMFRLYTDAEVLKYTGESPIESMAKMEEAIEIRVQNYAKYGYGRWATFLKENMQFIGWAGLAYLEEFDEVDLGYRFFPEYWSQGFATEASQAILRYGIEKLHLKRIIALALKDNRASIRVMEKAGMEFDKFAPYVPGGLDVVWYWCNKDLLSKKENKN